MSAECDRCGYDLPFMADCSYCEVVRQRDALLEALEMMVASYDNLADDELASAKARAAIAQAKGDK